MAAILSINPVTTSGNDRRYRSSFARMSRLMFVCGFLTVVNDLRVPGFEVAFTAGCLLAMLLPSGFFGACFGGWLNSSNFPNHDGRPHRQAWLENGVVAAGGIWRRQRVVLAACTRPSASENLRNQ